MALDRTYHVYPDGPTIWAEHSLRSPLVAIGATLRDQNDLPVEPEQTVTLRTRHRTDLNVSGVLTDRDGRVWVINELLELGRRKWLDISCSHYGGSVLVDGETPVDPVIPPVADHTPQARWGFQVDGVPVQSVTAETTTDRVYRWEGEWDDTGWTGDYTDAPHGVNARVFGQLPSSAGSNLVSWRQFARPNQRIFSSLYVYSQTSLDGQLPSADGPDELFLEASDRPILGVAIGLLSLSEELVVRPPDVDA